jgi:hypothetical protein
MDFESQRGLKEKKCILYLEKACFVFFFLALSWLLLYLSMEFKGEL